jgi:hypothetical protein
MHMGLIKGYLIITSIIGHLLVVISLFWLIPLYTNAISVGKSVTESMKKASHGKIEDLCEIEQNGKKYIGYKISYNDKPLYVMGIGPDEHKIGDTVKVLISDHPYGPLKTLIITLSKD